MDGERCLFDVSTAHWWMGKDVCLMCQLHTVVDGERCLSDVSTAHCGGWGKMSDVSTAHCGGWGKMSV